MDLYENLIEKIQQDLDGGFTKSELERLIRLPQNSLSNILNGKKKLSKKSIQKIILWNQSEKPDPFNLPPVEKRPTTDKKMSKNNGIRGKVFQGEKEIDIDDLPKSKVDKTEEPAKINGMPEGLSPLQQKIWLGRQDILNKIRKNETS